MGLQLLQNGITRLIEADLRALDGVIDGWLHSDIDLVRQVCEHIISSGGKRLRPALLMLAADCFGNGGDKKVLLAAVIVVSLIAVRWATKPLKTLADAADRARRARSRP